MLIGLDGFGACGFTGLIGIRPIWGLRVESL